MTRLPINYPLPCSRPSLPFPCPCSSEPALSPPPAGTRQGLLPCGVGGGGAAVAADGDVPYTADADEHLPGCTPGVWLLGGCRGRESGCLADQGLT